MIVEESDDMMHLRHRHPHELGNARNTSGVRSKQVVVARQHDSRIGGKGHGVSVAIGFRKQWDTTLVSVDSVRGRA